MGLFHHKQQQDDPAPQTDAPATTAADATAAQDQFFDEYFREELRNHGRWYFEKVLTENGDLFKQDLDATISQVKTELDQHVTTQVDATVKELDEYLKATLTRRLEEQFAQYNQALKATQDIALANVTASTSQLQEQHRQLVESLQKSVVEQTSLLHTAFDENKAEITAMKDAQAHALESLKLSAAEVQAQYQQLSVTLTQQVGAQREMIIKAFENQMAQVVEHYVLGALGEQFDLKAQLPSIIKQMEANKQAMTDDLRL